MTSSARNGAEMPHSGLRCPEASVSTSCTVLPMGTTTTQLPTSRTASSKKRTQSGQEPRSIACRPGWKGSSTACKLSGRLPAGADTYAVLRCNSFSVVCSLREAKALRGSSQVDAGAAWKSQSCTSLPLARPKACAMVPVTWCKCHLRSILSSCSLCGWNCAGLSANAVSSGRSSFCGELSFFASFAAEGGRGGPQQPLDTMPSMQSGWRASCSVTTTSMEFVRCAARSATVRTGYVGAGSPAPPSSPAAGGGVGVASGAVSPSRFGVASCQMMTSPDQSCSFFTGRFTLRGCRSRSLNSSQHSQAELSTSSGSGATCLLLTCGLSCSATQPSVTICSSGSLFCM
mmetsp:Transcript_88915/g.247010  ORF Transcript_88915/g.247010 Transcript_88915/m.247010 type:complete len:345 (-) Transcript_88915:2269-3303(-)